MGETDKKTGKRASRKMMGRMFTAKLYDMMGWAPRTGTKSRHPYEMQGRDNPRLQP